MDTSAEQPLRRLGQPLPPRLHK